MSIQRIINGIFRQNFRDRAVLGRVLFSTALFLIGWMKILGGAKYAGELPDYLPAPELLTLLIGIVLVFTGFSMLANVAIRKAVKILIGFLILLILLAYLPVGNVDAILETLFLIGGALLVGVVAERTVKEIEDTEARGSSGNSGM